ncbi:hypothetical protein [Butyrivibrio fibrisolvens]|uniref:hypothetical protein n=1 Tax=Butyrivibrio fibrisolvens TaxID=831 RepID=UPI0020BF6D3F|nr:hypothetical protein [Butyrivibrio fibrisolvens]
MNRDKLKWLFYEKRFELRNNRITDIIRRHIIIPVFGHELRTFVYGGKILHGPEYANKKIAELINGEKPFMVSRFGNTEINNLDSYMRKTICGLSEEYKDFDKKWWDNLSIQAGFFPKDESLHEKFAKVLYSSAKEVDVLGVWNRRMEDYYIRTAMPDVEITALRWLEPWYSDTPWTWALKGKKVLVIHPFEDSIKEQYQKRKVIFPENELLPECELDVLKAVQTLGDNKDDRFNTWFDALEYMYDEALKRDFDVAIIGCGAYGMPLAAMLKKAGKKTIHIGGVTQCLFGIKGSRWVNSPLDKKIPINEKWIYPKENETPHNSTDVENGCYWK